MNRSIEQQIRPTAIFGVLIALIAYFIIATGAPTNAAGAISLGNASSFGILAATGVTNNSTNPNTTVLVGDIGSSPSATITNPQAFNLTGTNHGGNSVTQSAQVDLNSALTNVSTQVTTGTIPLELGGQILTPGVYRASNIEPYYTMNGNLTFDAGGNPNAIFVIKGTRLSTSANVAKVVLANGAQSCNIYWSFVTAATNADVKLGFNTTMRGSILTDRDVTLMDNVVVTGRLLTTSGKVSVSYDYIYVPTCALPTPTPTPSASATPTPTPTPTSTGACTTMLCPSPTPTPTPTSACTTMLCPSPAPTPTPTLSPSPTPTPTLSPTPTPKPSVTPTPTPTPTPTSSASPSPTPTDPQVPIKPIGFVATGGGSPLKFRAAPAPVLLARSVPTSISMPAIGVKAKIVSLGFDSEGGMEVPTTGAVTGWFNGAPTPGELGPAIIVGHVDWEGKIAVFFKLKNLKKGDLVKVLRGDGKQVKYSVTRVLTVNKLKFPTELVYGDIDYAGLRLITCGGKFDSRLKRHVDNIIVFAKAVA